MIRRKRQPRKIENSEFAAFARRIVRAFGRRVAVGDVDALADLVAMRDSIDEAIVVAVAGLRQQGYSYGEMASRLGTSRQNIHQQWGRKAGSASVLQQLLAWQGSAVDNARGIDTAKGAVGGLTSAGGSHR